MIKIDSLTYGYSPNALVFQDYSWQANRGEAWAVLGPSGCGKTTLLYLLAGLLIPNSGQVMIDGHVLERPMPNTGLILQDYGLLPWATVRRNAELGIRIRNFYGPDGKHTPEGFRPDLDVKPWLERLGLAAFADKYPGQLSGGQRQRTAIARTLALKPDLLLMDEPFSSLDAPTREDLQGLVLELQEEQNLTLVIVTHAIEEAAVIGRKILILGQPPNQLARIVDNSGAGVRDYRHTTEYVSLCRELRSLLEMPRKSNPAQLSTPG